VAAYTVVALALVWRSRLVGAVLAAVVLGGMFVNVFLLDRHGMLVWHGTADA